MWPEKHVGKLIRVMAVIEYNGNSELYGGGDEGGHYGRLNDSTLSRQSRNDSEALRTASARLSPVHSCMSACCEATLMRPDWLRPRGSECDRYTDEEGENVDCMPSRGRTYVFLHCA